MRILLAEDEKAMMQIISKGLREKGFEVDVLYRGDDALEALITTPFDAAVLDIMMPGCDGLGIVQKLRERGNRIPILLISARSDSTEKVEGLDLGADDYLGKPFSVDELSARLRALLRRASGETISLYRVDDLVLNLPTRQVTRGSRKIELTAREFALLECLVRTPGQIFSRTQLCDRVWHYHFDPGTNIVDVYIQRLRRKIDDGETIKLIHTVRGAGYKVEVL